MAIPKPSFSLARNCRAPSSPGEPKMPATADYYVYVLFDNEALPRYVGKGRGKRAISTVKPGRRNQMKNAFLKRTREILGEVPLIIVRNNLTEKEALEIEIALIAAIGRRKNNAGPLTNISSGGDGMTSQEAKELAASFTPMERWLVNDAISKSHMKHSPQERSERGRRRQQNLGEKGRKELARKGTVTKMIRYTAEQRRFAALKASLAVSKVDWINNGSTCRRLGPDDILPDGWTYGRLIPIASVMAAKRATKNSRWATDGHVSQRLKSDETLPPGWVYGRKLKSAFSSAPQ